MSKELIINSDANEVEIALLESGKLVEVHSQKNSDQLQVGDIFIGRVAKLMPWMNAAFIDIGPCKDAFLHYTDLGPQLKSMLKWTRQSIGGKLNTGSLENFELEKDINKKGKIDQVLDKRQMILVQILKEPINTKGPRLSSEITLPGKYLVLTPFNNTVSVSKKISNPDERKRLTLLLDSIKPKNFGVILRTASEGRKVADLHEEITSLMDKWNNLQKQLKNADQPGKLMSELEKPVSLLRDLMSDDFNRIVVNNNDLYQNIKSYMGGVHEDKAKVVEYYKSKKPIFESFGINRQIKSSFGKTSTMPSGAYLVIEHTEAMHVIDVNSGPKRPKTNPENAMLNVNLEAAEEIARQIRLRDIGGLIVIDFIDMRSMDHKKAVYKKMVESMASDRAQHTILPLSKFGLMQITRERARPEIKINTAEKCPTCKGSGKVNATILLMDDIERDINFIMESRPKASFTMRVHPYINAYLKKGIMNKQVKWFLKFNKWIKIQEDPDLQFLDYKFFDQNSDEIRLN